MELFLLDYLTLEVNEGGNNVNVLVTTDHFIRYAQAIATSSQTTKCTAQYLWDMYIAHYSMPE